MKKITTILIIFCVLSSTFIIFHDNVDAIGQHESSDGTVYGMIQNETDIEINTYTYYFNETDASTLVNGANLLDGNTGTWAESQIDGLSSWAELDNHTGYSDTEQFFITKVEIRTHMKRDVGLQGTYSWALSPRYVDGDGQFLYVYPGTSPSWSPWLDITSLDNAPSSWTWSDVQNLGLWFFEVNTPDDTVIYASKIELRIVCYEQFIVTRDASISSETNNFSFTPSFNYSENVTFKIPVSNSVQGIINVTNNTAGGLATEVNSTAELVNNTFWYDSANDFLYIRTVNITTSSSINWTVFATYGMTFSLTLPTYLDVGDYFIATGLIKNATGVPVDGVLAKTRVLYSNGTDALETPPEWNCTNGNYYCVFSTSSLLPGIYSISIEFTDGGITYKEGGTLYLSYDTPTGVYSDALVFFNFYNTNEGLGLPTETLKVYVDDVRQYETVYYAYTNQVINVTIKDYYNTTLYSNDHTIVNTYTFLDFGLTFHSYKFCNKNERYYMISLLKAGSSRWYEKAVCPYETIEYVLPTGNYTLRIYNHTNVEIYNSTLPPSIVVNASMVYEIHGTNLSEIISGQSTIVGEILETRNETYNINNTVNDINDTTGVIPNMNNSVNDLLNRSIVVISFYNTNEGLGLDRETLLVYVDGSRLIGNVFHCVNGSTVNITVKDYYNFTLYQNDFSINQPFNFIDLGLTFHSWLFGNKNDDYYMVSLLKDGASRWWERGIVPYSEREYLIPSGNYTMRIYDKDLAEIINQSYTIVNSRVFVIHGTNLSEIISGQSIIRGQLLELSDDLYAATMPDVIRIIRNPPTIISVFDKVGQMIGRWSDQILYICPLQIVEATTINETVTNSTTSYPLVPRSTIRNGTIIFLEDVIYFAGPSGTAVNITNADNGSVISNTSYIPNKIFLFGENVTINATNNITITRETRYQASDKFDWAWRTYTDYNTATINVSNPLNTELRRVYVYAEYHNKSTPDMETIKVKDIYNDILLTYGEHYSADNTGIDFKLQGSMPANTYRLFSLSYYGINATASYEGYATTIIEEFDVVNKDGNAYNHFQAGWTNTRSLTYKGPLKIIMNFSEVSDILTERTLIYDRDNNLKINRIDFSFGKDSIEINPSIMGDVLPSSGRNFDVYFLLDSTKETGPMEANLNSVIFSFVIGNITVLITWAVIFCIILFALALLCFWRDTKFSIGLGAMFVFIIFLIIVLSFT